MRAPHSEACGSERCPCWLDGRSAEVSGMLLPSEILPGAPPSGDAEDLAVWLEGWCDHEGVPTGVECCAWGDAAARVRRLAAAAAAASPVPGEPETAETVGTCAKCNTDLFFEGGRWVAHVGAIGGGHYYSHAGSATTPRVAEQLGRKGWGSDARDYDGPAPQEGKA